MTKKPKSIIKTIWSHWLQLIAISLFSLSSSALFAEDLTIKIVSQKNKNADWAVATLKPLFDIDTDILTKLKAPKATMIQKDILFQPFVLAVQTGSEVTFPNQDLERHHVYSFSKAKRFELRLYSQDEDRSILFESPGYVAIGCNIHDNMLAYIHINDDPIRAIADEEGMVYFQDLPTGQYQLTVWHPDLRKKSEPHTETIDLTKETEQTVQLRLKRRRYQQEPSEFDDY